MKRGLIGLAVVLGGGAPGYAGTIDLQFHGITGRSVSFSYYANNEWFEGETAAGLHRWSVANKGGAEVGGIFLAEGASLFTFAIELQSGNQVFNRCAIAGRRSADR